jgi:hypothetical protein
MCSSSNGQTKINTNNKAPISIYTFNSIKINMHTIASLKKRLNIDSFVFQFTSPQTREKQQPLLIFKEIGKEKIRYVYDDYEKHENNNLLKCFLLKNDPTRWNLSCKENRIQPFFLNRQM